MRQLIKEYLSFTRRERVAIVGLLVLIISAYVLPYFVKPASKPPSARELHEFRKLEQQWSKAKNEEGNNAFAHTPPIMNDGGEEENAGPPGRLFYFDPNTLSAAGWKQLGLRSKTIGTILKYLSKGGRFYLPADVKKIYGLQPQEYARLERYIRISKPAYPHVPYDAPADGEGAHKTAGVTIGAVGSSDRNSFASSRTRFTASAKAPIDINTADTTAWISLPGIGSKLAARIVHFRERLGGFYDVQQVGETYGLQDSTFQKILPLLRHGEYQTRKINLNTADVETLKQHPYLRFNIAQAIVRYREQHGPFTSPEALMQVAAVTPGIYRKVAPYLALSTE
jgi:competence protein ComEA